MIQSTLPYLAGLAGLLFLLVGLVLLRAPGKQAGQFAVLPGVRYLVFYHTIPPLPLACLNAAFLGDAPRIFKGPITVGRDGMLVSLTAGSTAVPMRELL
jgi:ribonuclease Z